MARVEAHGVKLEKILVTHGHLDHAGGTLELAQALKLPIEGPQPEDKFWLEQITPSAAPYVFPAAHSFAPDRWLDHVNEVTVGALRFQVVHWPVHTPGHVVFFNDAARLA